MFSLVVGFQVQVQGFRLGCLFIVEFESSGQTYESMHRPFPHEMPVANLFFACIWSQTAHVWRVSGLKPLSKAGQVAREPGLSPSRIQRRQEILGCEDLLVAQGGRKRRGIVLEAGTVEPRPAHLGIGERKADVRLSIGGGGGVFSSFPAGGSAASLSLYPS